MKEEDKQYNIKFIIFHKQSKERVVQNTWIVKKETYEEVMDLLRNKQEKYEP